jgi:hypothetical protein
VDSRETLPRDAEAAGKATGRKEGPGKRDALSGGEDSPVAVIPELNGGHLDANACGNAVIMIVGVTFTGDLLGRDFTPDDLLREGWTIVGEPILLGDQENTSCGVATANGLNGFCGGETASDQQVVNVIHAKIMRRK